MKQYIFVLLLIGMWHVATQLELISPLFLPSIIEVLFSLKSILFTSEGAMSIALTLKRTIAAFVWGTCIAIPCGLVLGAFRNAYELCGGMIDFLRSIPVTALFPLFLIFFGFGDISKIAMGAWASGFIVLVNTMHGVWNTKNNRRVMAITKRATKFQIITKIMLPECLPFIYAGVRIGISWNLIVIIVSEMFIGASKGIGHIMYEASVLFDTATVFAGVFIIGSLGLLINTILKWVEKKYIHWNHNTTESMLLKHANAEIRSRTY